MNRRVPGVVLVLGCSFVGAFFGAACSSASTPSAPSPAGPEARFAVGATPYLALFNGLGHAPSCETVFEASSVLTLVASPGGAPEPRLVAPGPFTGRCGETVLAFESVPVAAVTVVTSMTHDGLAPFEVDHAHPDWPVSLRATPRDAAGAALNPGSGLGYATWTPGEGCAASLQLVVPMAGKPSDSVSLTPLAAGKCALRVDYFGAHSDVTVTVR
jgi:hypothetical protein